MYKLVNAIYADLVFNQYKLTGRKSLLVRDSKISDTTLLLLTSAKCLNSPSSDYTTILNELFSKYESNFQSDTRAYCISNKSDIFKYPEEPLIKILPLLYVNYDKTTLILNACSKGHFNISCIAGAIRFFEFIGYTKNKNSSGYKPRKVSPNNTFNNVLDNNSFYHYYDTLEKMLLDEMTNYENSLKIAAISEYYAYNKKEVNNLALKTVKEFLPTELYETLKTFNRI